MICDSKSWSRVATFLARPCGNDDGQAGQGRKLSKGHDGYACGWPAGLWLQPISSLYNYSSMINYL